MKNQKQEIMFARVAEWKRSGISKDAFAQDAGISKSCFEYWVRKANASTQAKNNYPQFLELCSSLKPLTVSEEEESQFQNLPNPQIVLTFPSGLCLKIYG